MRDKDISPKTGEQLVKDNEETQIVITLRCLGEQDHHPQFKSDTTDKRFSR